MWYLLTYPGDQKNTYNSWTSHWSKPQAVFSQFYISGFILDLYVPKLLFRFLSIFTLLFIKGAVYPWQKTTRL